MGGWERHLFVLPVRGMAGFFVLTVLCTQRKKKLRTPKHPSPPPNIPQFSSAQSRSLIIGGL
jgi:hypothetical protein